MNVRNSADIAAQLFPAQATTSSAASRTADSASSQNLNGDKAELSIAGTQIAQSATSSVTDSDVRLDKVASIQAALQAGTYAVPVADVAKKVIDSLIAPEK